MATDTASLTGWRRGVDRAFVYLMTLFFIAVLVQVFLAGVGVFGDHVAKVEDASSFDAHRNLGFILGGVLVMTLVTDDRWQIVTVLGAAIVGALFGAWVASMVGIAVPNSRLRQFAQAIDEGKLLLMADVPEHRVDDIRRLLNARHPEAEDRGIDPHIPAFP